MSKGLCQNCGFDEVFRLDICEDCYTHSVILTREDGSEFSWYTPQPHQRPYHESNAPNLLAWGTRGTGKSTQMRKDAIIRCMTYEGYKVLILRRKIPDLRKSHLQFINHEMELLGRDVGYYRETTFDVKFVNNSFIQFSHCEKLKDVENYLSSEWDLIIFDEVSTFPLEMFLTISAAARSPTNAPYVALVRCGSNTLGIGAEWMKAWFIDHVVRSEDYPDYIPEDFESIFSTLDENKYTNRAEYTKRLKNLPEHIKRSYLYGEFVVEGSYFSDFRRIKDEKPWHVIDTLPTWQGQPLFAHSWLSVYRCIDWGYSPDPAVCIWIAVLPNKRAIAFKELSWKKTLAKDVALEIKKASANMHIVESFCDPTMLIKEGQAYSIGEIFEQNGVPVTASTNDRILYGYSIHEYLNTLVDETPQLQIVRPMGLYGCPDLIRTLPILLMDKADPRKIADGDDHWAVALAYFCMGQASPSKDPAVGAVPRWMTRHRRTRMVVG